MLPEHTTPFRLSQDKHSGLLSGLLEAGKSYMRHNWIEVQKVSFSGGANEMVS